MKSYIQIMLIICAVVFLTSVAWTQDSEEDTTAATPAATKKTTKRSYKNKRTEVNFEDQLIKGEVQKPELFYLLQKKQFNFGKLIKLRENFLPEMRKTAEDVPRGVDD